MRRRPMIGVLALFLVIIIAWWHWGRPPYQKLEIDQGVITGAVDAIQTGSSSERLILEDVVIETTDKQDARQIRCHQVIVYNNSEGTLFTQVKLGNIIHLEGTVSSFSIPGNPGQFNEYEYYRQLNIDYKIFPEQIRVVNPGYNKVSQWLWECRKKLCQVVEETLPENDAGILSAMLFGEKSALPEDTKLLYQRSGISHLLAISGLHVTILGGALFFFLRKYIMKMQWAALFTILILILYGELTGFSIATSRAVIMMICMLTARVLGRSYDVISAMCLAAIITLLQQPFSLFQPGMLLSYGTVLGIYFLTPIFEEKLNLGQKEDIWGKSIVNILRTFLASFSATITTLPIVLWSYYEVPTYSCLLNLLVMPFVTVVVGFGFMGALLGMFWTPFGQFFMGTVHYVLQYYEVLCGLNAQLPGASWNPGQPLGWQLLIYYVGLGLFIILWRRRRGVYSLLLLLVLLVPRTEPAMEFTMLDVGQGDGLFIRSSGQTMLMDGGSSDVKEVGKYRIRPFLKWHGTSKIDVICISHPDSDHVSGLLELIENADAFGLDIGKVLLPGIEKPDQAYLELEKKIQKAGVPILKICAGDTFSCGSMSFRCVYPTPDTSCEDPNEYSMVLEGVMKNFSLLLTGDLGVEGEKMIIPELGHIDVLKVGHHGSKNSTSTDLLEAIDPEIAIVSVGLKNRYGHPSKETMERLRESQTKMWCTKDVGAITVTSDGEKYKCRND